MAFGQRVASLALLLVGLASEAQAEGPPAKDPRAQAKAAFVEAEQAAEDLHFAQALAKYQAAAQIDPSGPLARVARARAHDLETHAEGNFVPLARLEAVRRKPDEDRATIEALGRDARGFAEGRVRSEAQIVAAEALWHRFGDLEAAAIALGAALDDPAADKLTRALALSDLVALERERGDLGAADRAVSRFPDLAPNLYAEVKRLVRRVFLARLSALALALLGGVAIASIVRIARRTKDLERVVEAVIRPRSVAFALYVGGGAAIFVRLYGEGDVRPFLWLGFGVLGVDIAARAWREGSQDKRAIPRALRALGCMIGVLAVAFLSLERANAGYLESFGL